MTETYGEWRERVGLPSLAINVDPVEAQRGAAFEVVAELEYDRVTDRLSLTNYDAEVRQYIHLTKELETAQAVVREIAAAIESIRFRLGWEEE